MPPSERGRIGSLTRNLQRSVRTLERVQPDGAPVRSELLDQVVAEVERIRSEAGSFR
jgi:hypothetical protein